MCSTGSRPANSAEYASFSSPSSPSQNCANQLPQVASGAAATSALTGFPGRRAARRTSRRSRGRRWRSGNCRRRAGHAAPEGRPERVALRAYRPTSRCVAHRVADPGERALRQDRHHALRGEGHRLGEELGAVAVDLAQPVQPEDAGRGAARAGRAGRTSQAATASCPGTGMRRPGRSRGRPAAAGRVAPGPPAGPSPAAPSPVRRRRGRGERRPRDRDDHGCHQPRPDRPPPPSRLPWLRHPRVCSADLHGLISRQLHNADAPDAT